MVVSRTKDYKWIGLWALGSGLSALGSRFSHMCPVHGATTGNRSLRGTKPRAESL